MRARAKQTCAALVLASGIILGPRSAFATKTFVGSSIGDQLWSNPSNWSDGVVPTDPWLDNMVIGPIVGKNWVTIDVPSPTVTSLRLTQSPLWKGNPLHLTGSISAAVGIEFGEMNLILDGSDTIRGHEVLFTADSAIDGTRLGNPSGAAVMHFAEGQWALGHVTDPQNLRNYTGVPTNTGGAYSLDPGAVVGMYIENNATVTWLSSNSGTRTFFGNAATAILLGGGTFAVSDQANNVTIPNPIDVIASSSGLSRLDVASSLAFKYLSSQTSKLQLNLTGPIELAGDLAIQAENPGNDPLGFAGLDRFGSNIQGTITVTGADRTLVPAMHGGSFQPLAELISGDIRDDGTPRKLYLGQSPSPGYAPTMPTNDGLLFFSGNNMGLSGGFVLNGGNHTTAMFLNEQSMGPKVLIGPGTIAGLEFQPTLTALSKIDPTSTGALSLNGGGSLDIDLSGLDVWLTSAFTWSGTHNYSGRILPHNHLYKIAGSPGFGLLANDALSGADNSLLVDTLSGFNRGNVTLGGINSYGGDTTIRGGSALIAIVPG